MVSLIFKPLYVEFLNTFNWARSGRYPWHVLSLLFYEKLYEKAGYNFFISYRRSILITESDKEKRLQTAGTIAY